jgi:predicted peptidase
MKSTTPVDHISGRTKMSGTQDSSQAISPGNWSTKTVNGMQYEVLLPANYDPNVQYATVLYLHQLDLGNNIPN